MDAADRAALAEQDADGENLRARIRLHEEYDRAERDWWLCGFEPPSATEFSLESGRDQLARHFDSVERHERESALRVPDLEPLVAYTASLQGVDRSGVTAFADLADERLADGPLEIGKSMGLFVAEKA